MKAHGRFIQGEVVKLTDTAATLADGTTLEFDYAAVCTGSEYSVGKGFAATAQDRKAEIQVRCTMCNNGLLLIILMILRPSVEEHLALQLPG